ncbi:MAG: glycine--tRNA ligase subunit beta [Chitinivorax sp.]
MSTKNLLVELFVEELPPKALNKLGESFSTTLADSLKAQGLVAADAKVEAFASPRRLAVHVSNVAAVAADKPITLKLMPVNIALDANGEPTQALMKKLAGMGLDASIVPTLKRAPDGKAEALFHDSVVKGVALAEGLQKALEQALTSLPIPKVMTYQLADGWSSVNFVRPAHKLVALHGADIVPISVLGLQAGRETLGHRFEAAVSPVVLENADSYAHQLQTQGAVIASFAERRAEIVRQLQAAAAKAGSGLQPLQDDALLDEVTALVERPNVLTCQFEPEFLQVPQECLILTMKANQKYFPLLESNGKLSNQFLVVSNISPADASAVITGNERVVRPRLADAKFFFDQDRKHKLETRLEKLRSVVYHNKLGSQLQRVERMQKLAGEIAQRLHADPAQAQRAAYLAKADLVTDMVGEFPELQGIMGGHYARHDGETAAVAQAVEQHYWPRFAGDSLPADNIGACAALADKLETLVGIWGIGLQPTGDKDPFGLRRAALGVLRILLETPLPLDLVELLEVAKAGFTEVKLADDTVSGLFDFMLDRLRNYLTSRDYAADVVEAVIAQKPHRIDQVLPRVEAVRAFRALPEAEALAAANKRISNILKKTEVAAGEPDFALLQESAEKALFEALSLARPVVASHLANGDYTDALKALAALRGPVDGFFEDVMVMTDEPLLRQNRLNLLAQLGQLLNGVADISRLAA